MRKRKTAPTAPYTLTSDEGDEENEEDDEEDPVKRLDSSSMFVLDAHKKRERQTKMQLTLIRILYAFPIDPSSLLSLSLLPAMLLDKVAGKFDILQREESVKCQTHTRAHTHKTTAKFLSHSSVGSITREREREKEELEMKCSSAPDVKHDQYSLSRPPPLSCSEAEPLHSPGIQHEEGLNKY